MSDKFRRRLAATALCLGLAALHVILILTALHFVGTDGNLYYTEQLLAGIDPDSEMGDAGLRVLDGQLADYLGGNAEALNDAPFNDREMAHMADCLYLFDLLRKVRARLIPWVLLLTLGGAWLLQDRKKARLCAWCSPLFVLVPLGAFAVYAMLNFDAAFTLFHKILFTNDLWLLDPRTDLLIRICPQSMFMHMGIRIAVYSLIGILAATAIAVLITFIWPKRKEDNAWKTTTRRGPAPRQYDFKSRAKR